MYFRVNGRLRLLLMLLTACGRISCRRCLGVAARSGNQCGRPALRNSQIARCQNHGGSGHVQKSVQPCKRRSRQVHGNETRSARLQRSEEAAHLAHLISCLQVLGEADVKHRAGRPPKGFNAITTLSGVHRYLTNHLHSEKAPRRHKWI